MLIENTTAIKIELNVAAQKIIHQFMTGNELIEEQLKKAIEDGITEFDFELEVKKLVQRQLSEAVRESVQYGKLRELVAKKAESIFNKMIEKEFEKYKDL